MQSGSDASYGQPTAEISASRVARESGRIEQLFREHNESLLRFIAAKLGSMQEARDVTQEAYVRLLRLENQGAVSHLRAFLFRTASNLAIDLLRQKARAPRVSWTEPEGASVFELSPDRKVGSEQELVKLNIAIDELPPKCREAFLLYRLEGLNCEEVASRMGLQERMVRLYVARALEHIRRHLQLPSLQPSTTRGAR